MTATAHGLTRFDQLMKACLRGQGPARPAPQVLGRMFPANPVEVANIDHAGVIDALDELAGTMLADTNADGPADAGMTFLGQFVDHDVTLDATSALGTRIDPATIANVRTPGLDLDCVYGAGPEASGLLYGDAAHGQDHFLLFGRDDNHDDLARTCAGKALIGDHRNDENIVVSQVQGLFIKLHNILMSKLSDSADVAADVCDCARHGIAAHVWHDHVKPQLTSFEEVRRFIRLHYQWIVWNELLPAFVQPHCLQAAIWDDRIAPHAPAMPVEFSGACYRFGHATTQATYQMTAGGAPRGLFDMRGFGPRPIAANLDMDRFFSLAGGSPAQRARPVAPKLGQPLFALPFVENPVHLADIDEDLSLERSANLALRNMVRDRYTYQLASGQSVAAAFGADPVDVPDALRSRGITKTPLWFYALQEAETHGGGRLTGAGGAVVATVFANLLRRDPNSVVHLPGFTPWSGFGGHPTCMGGIVAYVRANAGHVRDPEHLRCG
ncbi:peroxidase family protein [Jannaschia sp. LMIT008]|uniref:peroxidase family protein n=1 Tax=Jannaschia maritima TaxID=3032585 RepID=UPI0028125464|nr:peroxidase family protein [Jannaschia sp. LMIT008]